MQKRQEILTWTDLTRLVDYLLQQFDKTYTCILPINQNAMIPGALLAEAMDIRQIYLISVQFPFDLQLPPRDSMSIEWPVFNQFPDVEQLKKQELLLVSEHWHTGREIFAAKARLEREGLNVDCAVLHFDPAENRLEGSRPHFYAARSSAEIVYPWQAKPGLFPNMVSHF